MIAQSKFTMRLGVFIGLLTTILAIVTADFSERMIANPIKVVIEKNIEDGRG